MINKKINISLIKKVEILSDIDLKFVNKNISIYKFNTIYILYLIKAFILKIFFLNKNSLKKIYFSLLVKAYAPKIVISNEINKLASNFKKINQNIVSITYQSATHWENEIQKIKIIYSNKNFITDYFLVYDNYFKIYFNFIKTEIIPIGSIKSNTYKENKKEEIYDLMFISEFRKNEDLIYKNNNDGAAQKNFKNVITTYLLEIISKYCKLNNKKMVFALSSTRKDKINKINFQDEINFFKNICGNEISFEKNTNSYDLSTKSKLCICLTSNLGAELLFRHKKILFLNPDYFVLKWPFINSIDGDFWYCGYEEKKIFEKIDDLLNTDKKKWDKILSDNNIINSFDPKNNKIHSILKKYS